MKLRIKGFNATLAAGWAMLACRSDYEILPGLELF
jgi:hypothetical protein